VRCHFVCEVLSGLVLRDVEEPPLPSMPVDPELLLVPSPPEDVLPEPVLPPLEPGPLEPLGPGNPLMPVEEPEGPPVLINEPTLTEERGMKSRASFRARACKQPATFLSRR
jgi:hypothetical protein